MQLLNDFYPLLRNQWKSLWPYVKKVLIHELTVINHIFWKVEFGSTSPTQASLLLNSVIISLERVTKTSLRLWDSNEPHWDPLSTNGEILE